MPESPPGLPPRANHDVGADPSATLRDLCAETLRRPVPEALRTSLAPLRREIEERHGDACLAILLYGSCLRAGNTEGVPDLILVVRDYASAYKRRRLRLANRWLPPNVFPIFAAAGDSDPLRAKYAVISLADLARACRGDAADSFVWARLCQPMALLGARDEATRNAVARCAADAVETMVSMALPVVAAGRERFPLDAEALWTRGFGETYKAEWRVETRQRSGDLVGAERPYYEAATDAVLERLEEHAALRRPGKQVELDPVWARRAQRSWSLRRRTGKTIGVLRLLKSALTFGDWVPYALWKLERHTGVHLEATETQRKHPFLFAWPLVFRALRARLLR